MNKVQYISGSFIDFKGQERKFVMAAVSIVDNEAYVDYSESENFVDTPKCVSIGVSVCLPYDKFDEELGKKIAYGKATKSVEHRLYATDEGLINTTMITGLLEQESEYFKKNPGRYLKGYDAYKAKYEHVIRIEGYIDKLDEPASTALNYVAQIEDEDLDKFTEAVNYLRIEWGGSGSW